MTDVNNRLADLGIRISSEYGTAHYNESFPNSHPYMVTLRYGRRSMRVPFYMGPALTDEPTAADVLSCLILDASATEISFEEWCADLGYDEDSRKAEATYRACVKNGQKVRRLLGDAFDTVAETLSDY
jgi:hypothetical protein